MSDSGKNPNTNEGTAQAGPGVGPSDDTSAAPNPMNNPDTRGAAGQEEQGQTSSTSLPSLAPPGVDSLPDMGASSSTYVTSRAGGPMTAGQQAAPLPRGAVTDTNAGVGGTNQQDPTSSTNVINPRTQAMGQGGHQYPTTSQALTHDASVYAPPRVPLAETNRQLHHAMAGHVMGSYAADQAARNALARAMLGDVRQMPAPVPGRAATAHQWTGLRTRRPLQW